MSLDAMKQAHGDWDELEALRESLREHMAEIQRLRAVIETNLRDDRRGGEEHMTPEEIHNIWLHMSGKSEGLLEAGGQADFPVLFANAILEYNKRQWQGLTDEEIWSDGSTMDLSEDGIRNFARAIEAKLREKNT